MIKATGFKLEIVHLVRFSFNKIFNPPTIENIFFSSELSKLERLSVSCLFSPSLIFVRKAGSYPSGAPFRSSAPTGANKH
jgi:hypothetical protein